MEAEARRDRADLARRVHHPGALPAKDRRRLHTSFGTNNALVIHKTGQVGIGTTTLSTNDELIIGGGDPSIRLLDTSGGDAIFLSDGNLLQLQVVETSGGTTQTVFSATSTSATHTINVGETEMNPRPAPSNARSKLNGSLSSRTRPPPDSDTE